MPGDQHHRQAFIQGLEAGQQFQAVDARQANIADDDAGKVFVDVLQRLFGTGHTDAGDVLQREGLLAAEQHMGVVFDDQDGQVSVFFYVHVDSVF